MTLLLNQFAHPSKHFLDGRPLPIAFYRKLRFHDTIRPNEQNAWMGYAVGEIAWVIVHIKNAQGARELATFVREQGEANGSLLREFVEDFRVVVGSCRYANAKRFE